MFCTLTICLSIFNYRFKFNVKYQLQTTVMSCKAITSGCNNAFIPIHKCWIPSLQFERKSFGRSVHSDGNAWKRCLLLANRHRIIVFLCLKFFIEFLTSKLWSYFDIPSATLYASDAMKISENGCWYNKIKVCLRKHCFPFSKSVSDTTFRRKRFFTWL